MEFIARHSNYTNRIPAGDTLNFSRVSGQAPYVLELFTNPSVTIKKETVLGSKNVGPFPVDVGYRVSTSTTGVNVFLSNYLSGHNSLKTVNEIIKDDQDILSSHDNSLINIYPTRVASPFNGEEEATYTSKSDNVAIDSTMYDPVSGFAMAKVTFAIGEKAEENIDYEDLDTITMSPDDIWMMSVYLPERLSGINIMLTIDDGATVTGSRKLVVFSTDSLQKGYNLLSIMNNEIRVGTGEYNEIGTTSRANWQYIGAADEDTSQFKSIRTSVSLDENAEAEVNVYLGSVFVAQSGWAKAAVMWYADDVPLSFFDLAVPIIESYGWKYAVAAVSTYTSFSESGLMAPLSRIKHALLQGNEVWSHCRKHENMPEQTSDNKVRALVAPKKYYASKGMNDATKFLMWPNGAYDDDSVQAAKDAGYLLAGSINGDEINPFMAGVNPYNISRFGIEKTNPWAVDAQLNGAIKRGNGIITYGHHVVAGGHGINSNPAPNSFYSDHLKRWCDLVAEHESAGRCVVTTPLKYFRMCGIEPDTDTFIE